MIKTVLAESKYGVHKCEVASKLESYLPCPYPECPKGISANTVYIPIESDTNRNHSWTQGNVLDGPPMLVEIYERMSMTGKGGIGKVFMWSFKREEIR